VSLVSECSARVTRRRSRVRSRLPPDASLLDERATLAEIKEILGHADIKTTLRYAHLSPGHLRGAVARLEGLTSPHETAHGPHIEVKSGSSVA
jgi:integrase